jgi:PAS domain S-box-containing protein
MQVAGFPEAPYPFYRSQLESTGSSCPSTWGPRPHILYNVIPVNTSDVPPTRGWGWWNVAESTSTHVPIYNASGAQSDQLKTKKQLIAELDKLRAQLAALEALFDEQGQITNFSRPRTPYGHMPNGSRGPHPESSGGSYSLGKLALDRNLAYETLRQQFALTLAIMESLGEGVCALDHAGHFTRINPAASAMLGWSGAELLGKDFHGKLHPLHASTHDSSPAERCSLKDVIRDGRTIRCEDTFTRKDGTTFPVSYVVSPIISDHQILGAVLSFHDITERKQLENALRQNERDAVERASQLEAIVEAMTDAVLVFNREARIIHANTAAWRFVLPDTVTSSLDMRYERMSQYAVRDEHGRPVAIEDIPLYRILRGETLTNDNLVDIFMRTPEGCEVEVNISGAPFRGLTGEIEGAVLIIRDVTEPRKRERRSRDAAREALRQAEELEAILDAITDIVLVFDRDGHIVRGNTAASAYMKRLKTNPQLDMPPQERAPYYNLRDANNQPILVESTPLRRVLAGETIAGAHAFQITYRGSDGCDRQLQISGAPLRDSYGHNCGAVMVYKTDPLSQPSASLS